MLPRILTPRCTRRSSGYVRVDDVEYARSELSPTTRVKVSCDTAAITTITIAAINISLNAFAPLIGRKTSMVARRLP